MAAYLQNLLLDGSLIEEFVIELLIAEGIFCKHLEKREKFAGRTALVFFAILALSFYWPYKNNFDEVGNIIRLYCILRYMLLFALSLLGLYYCFSCSVNTIIFCGTGAYAMQHFTFCVNRITLWFLGEQGVKTDSVSYFLVALAGCTVSYLAIYLIFVRHIQREKIRAEKEIYVPALLVLVFTVTINYYRWNDLACNIYGAIICVLTCWILAGIFRYSQLQQEMTKIHHMMALKEEYYQISKENIEAINVKCHDLKHQISRIRRKQSQGDMDPYLKEVEQNILIYDSIAETGSDVLNVILTEKKMLCDQKGIMMTYMIDGEKVSFMRDSDLYALFGNAVDNAMESVAKIEQPEKRMISISVKAVGAFVSIHFDNPFVGKLVFRDGILVTTKSDRQYHGYGLKSIEMIAEKYNGKASISAEGERFNLNILIPIPE